MSFPSELRGYVYSDSDGSLTNIDYSTESSKGSVGTFQSGTGGIAVPTTFGHYYGAEEAAGVLQVIDNYTGTSYSLNIPNVYKVAVNTGDTVALAMVRNSNTIYRIFKLNQGQYATNQLAIAGTGSADCQPLLLPVYCAVPVPGRFDQPYGVYFSLDGTTAYVLNCGPECGGATAGLTLLEMGPLNENVIASTASPAPAGYIPPQLNPPFVAIPGGVTDVLSDGTTLYIAGQQQQADELFEGFLTTLNQATNTITGTYAISDGTHTKMLFADDNTLWIGSQYCATGEREKQGLNYNCLTMVTLSGGVPQTVQAVQIVPDVTPGSATAVVQYPNQNDNLYYYGNLTGLCWVENYNKVYTAYGGQVHLFSTVDGSEIDNSLVVVQGTALDVAYMDATTDGAN
jgi:hypothetical protein